MKWEIRDKISSLNNVDFFQTSSFKKMNYMPPIHIGEELSDSSLLNE